MPSKLPSSNLALAANNVLNITSRWEKPAPSRKPDHNSPMPKCLGKYLKLKTPAIRMPRTCDGTTGPRFRRDIGNASLKEQPMGRGGGGGGSSSTTLYVAGHIDS